MSDVARIQVSLELFFNEQNQYPVTDGRIALGQGGALCLSSAGFKPSCPSSGRVFLNPVPSRTSLGIKGSDLDVYAYESDGESYAISFMIERAVPQAEIEKGLVCAYPGQAIHPAVSGRCSL